MTKWKMNKSIIWMLVLMGFSTQAFAHSGTAAGWYHPLSGLDHLLAMIAVGAWSVQIGKKAVWIVPSAFVCFMFIGGLIGFEHIEISGTEVGVSLSVVLLGLAIAFRQLLPVTIAAIATGIFGIFHGYAHGYEMPLMDNKITYTIGFLATTATLHIVGAVGAHWILKLHRGGMILRVLGAITGLCGIGLIAQL